MQKAEIYPRLKLGERKVGTSGKESVHSTGPHTVRVLKDKIGLARDRETGTIIEVVKYVLEEGGVKKEYKCPLKNKETKELHYLVQIFSKVAEGEEVVLEMKKAGPRNYVEVRHTDGTRIDTDDGSDVTDEDTVNEDTDDVLNSDDAGFDKDEGGAGIQL